MRAFAQLFSELDRTTRTSGKLRALEDYFRTAPPPDAAWALWFLVGRRLTRVVKSAHLVLWTAEVAGLPLWLVEECREHVGDLGETLALLLPSNPSPNPPELAQLIEGRLLPLAGAPENTQRTLLRATWSELDTPQRFLWHKLITGNFRVGVSRALVVRALASVAGVDPAIMAHRLMGDWRPNPIDLARLMNAEGVDDDPAKPYPFFLASTLEANLPELGEVHEWQFEWKWDGIRAQLIRRAGEVILWSRGEEIITPTFPEIAEAAVAVPEGTVLDGELLAWGQDTPLPFAQLQRRLNRREARIDLQREVPVVFMAYDLLEFEGIDWRERPLQERRDQLEKLMLHAAAEVPHGVLAPQAGAWSQGDLFLKDEPPPHLPPALQISHLLPAASWEEVEGLRQRARDTGTEGVMIKRRDTAYGVGRQRGAWWKWKVAPYTCDAVLVAAQPGHGQRATLFTDYTFGVWADGELVPIAKAYSGLTDAEIDQVDAFVRGNTTGRFGPVRSVRPELVFELAFEGIAPSTRHKSGLALRFPRIARWRQDKRASQADRLEALRHLAQEVHPPC